MRRDFGRRWGGLSDGVSQPSGSPDILGVSAKAGFGATLGILLGLPVIAIQLPGFGTGLATVALVLALGLALREGGQVLVTVLCGIAIGALAGAGISLVMLLADPEEQLPAITFWLMGSLAGINASMSPWRCRRC